MKPSIHALFAASLFAFMAPIYAQPASNNANTQSVPLVSTEDRAKIESVVHDYLLSKPEILVQALQILQQKQYQEAEKTVKETQQTAPSFAKDLFHKTSDPVGGNPNGKVTVVEFFDYQCPHCVDMVPIMDAIVRANPDVRVVYKEFPIRGPMSNVASRAALAANKQGKYFAFSHALFSIRQPLTEEIIWQVAKSSGLDVDQLKRDMNDKAISDQIDANIKLAQELKLFGTPAIFIGLTTAQNGKINYTPGQMDQAQMQKVIDTTKNQ